MNNESYLNYYIETMTSVMTDAIVRNVSLQASLKMNEETIEALDAEIGRLKNAETDRVSQQQIEIVNLNKEISRLNTELEHYKSLKNEFETSRNQIEHLNTFKSEVVKCREENKKLLDQIEFLQLPPAKRKKIEQSKIKEEEVQSITNESVKDAGFF